jgi:hypothetical protein
MNRVQERLKSSTELITEPSINPEETQAQILYRASKKKS